MIIFIVQGKLKNLEKGKQRCIYERLKQGDLFFTTRRNYISYYSITDFAHNVRSLSKQIYGIVSDNRMITYNIAGFTEKQINASSSTYKIIETLNF